MFGRHALLQYELQNFALFNYKISYLSGQMKVFKVPFCNNLKQFYKLLLINKSNNKTQENNFLNNF